jgi:hypothetical protein
MKLNINTLALLISLCSVQGCMSNQYSSTTTSENHESVEIIPNVVVEGTYDVQFGGVTEYSSGNNVCQLIDCHWVTLLEINPKSIVLQDSSHRYFPLYAIPINKRVRASGSLHINRFTDSKDTPIKPPDIYLVADSLERIN